MIRTEGTRRLATVLVTDIVGSTERAAALGDHAWQQLLHHHDRLVRREISRFEGHEINTAGDGFLATFAAPERAIRCACAIRDAVRALGLELRFGLHTGEVAVEEGTAGGIAVHIAARVVARSGPGEILVSGTVRDLATGSGYGFEDRGAHALKGVPGEWRLHAVTSEPVRLPTRGQWRGARARLATLRGSRAVAAGVFTAVVLFGLTGVYLAIHGRGRDLSPPPLIAESAAPGMAVLPFRVSGADLDVSREGFADLLSTNLDGVGGLRAIDSRTVLARWHEGPGDEESPGLEDMLQVARASGARYALVGRAVALGDGMRLDAELYDLRDGTKLGQARVDGSRGDMIGLVDRLSVQVLRAAMRGREPPSVSLASVTTDSLEALKAYLQGEARLRHAEFEDAIAAFQRAVAIDSSFALAWFRLGVASSWVEYPEAAAGYFSRAIRSGGRLPEREGFLVRAHLALHRGTFDGVRLLELQVVNRYPDDAEAWYLLGDTYVHMGAQALSEPDAGDSALAHAVALDPSFAPFHLHLVESAFHHADSARAARLVETYERLAPGTIESRRNRRAFELAFGGPAARAREIEGLDSLSALSVSTLARGYLWHPRFLAIQEAVLTSRPRPEGAEGGELVAQLAANAFDRGRFGRALSLLEDPLVPHGFRAAALYSAHALGLPVPRRLLDKFLVFTPSEESLDVETFYAGAYAADQGRLQDHERASEILRADAARLMAAGDSAGARFAEGAAGALEAYGMWKRGQAAEAARLLQAAQRRATGWDDRALVNATIRLWLGQLFLESGQLVEAERYLKRRESDHATASFSPDVLTALQLGRIYEDLGEHRKAREAYEWFATAWRDADAAFQPLVQEATSAARRLSAPILD